jgi:DNA-binding MarR family transcriptional regulator
MTDFDRETATNELLDELTHWNARDRKGAFKKWLQGAFSLIHLNVLTVLEADGPSSMSRLAEALDVSVASATGIVDRMETRGLVLRKHDIGDRRVVLVEKTDAGTDVFKAMAEHRRAMLARILARLTDEELQGMLLGARAMHKAREAIAAEDDALRAAALAGLPPDLPARNDRPQDRPGPRDRAEARE